MAKSSAKYFEVRWRIQGSDEAWSAPQRVDPASEIVVENLDRTKTYEFEARAVSACGAKSVWAPSTDHTVPGAADGTLTLAEIRGEVDAAKASSAAALEQLDAIDDDGLLTPAEKPTVIRDVAVIENEKPGLVAQATAYGLTTELEQFQQAYDDLMAHLATLTSPVPWNNLSGNTTLTQ